LRILETLQSRCPTWIEQRDVRADPLPFRAFHATDLIRARGNTHVLGEREKQMRVRASFVVAWFAALLSAAASPAFAQSRGGGAAEGFVGYAGFLDDTTITHTSWGGAARWYVLPRVAIGPELVYFKGPGDDRDLIVTGNVTFDVLRRARPLTPFLIAGGGFFRHSDRFGASTFTSTEGSFTGGGGLRFSVGRKFYVAPELRTGWEPHLRFSVAAGWRFND
jgi:hypothetical protein